MNQTSTPETNKQTGNGIDNDVRNSIGSSPTGSQKSSGTSSFGMTSNQSEPQRHSEGVVARTIEEQTAKLPSDTFLWGAVAAMGVSAFFEFTGDKDKSRFVGQWVAPLLLFGVYNKLVKQQGSDRVHS
jgi:hypothetical protein